MKNRKKRKLKIKNIIIVLIVFLTLGLTMQAIVKSNPKKQKEEKNEVKTKKKTLTEQEEKYKELSNINKKLDYFKDDYLERYLKYKKNNQNLTDEQIIKNVNMNLDLEKYEQKQPAKYLNTEKILVNKYYYLEPDYVPENLEPIDSQYANSNMKMVKIAKEAFEKLATAAKKENLNIIAMSTYRSYDYQTNLYDRYVQQDGKENADTYSGRPGHSEHQTGLAADVYNKIEPYTNFEKTKEFEWMQEHAHEYGFILRFPKDKVEETGYQFESWHYRYVGLETAKYIKEHNISFEEYYATIIDK